MATKSQKATVLLDEIVEALTAITEEVNPDVAKLIAARTLTIIEDAR